MKHAILLARLARKVNDKRVLKLIRDYLEAGVCAGGLLTARRALDGCLRRHLRKILWRQWKRSFTRAKMLMRWGLDEQRAWNSAQNGRGTWWNAGASQMHQALSKKRFDRIGLVSLVDYNQRLKCLS